jgi:TRAP-type C4-dicarboxylate transport system substrate-binding protein
MLINFQVVGSKFFDGLPAEYQAALVEECKRAGRETSEKILASEQAVKQQLKGRGMTINENVDLAAFRKAGEAAYEKLGIADAKKAVHAEISR